MSNDNRIRIQQEIYKCTLKTTPPYCGLMSWFLEKQLLEAAWHKVRETEGANTPGSRENPKAESNVPLLL